MRSDIGWFVTTYASDKDACVVTVDLRNALNSLKREAVVQAVKDTPLSVYTLWAYGTHPQLRFGNAIIYSATGVQQGDPAGPVLFAFALDKALQSAHSDFDPNVIDLWYADDGCLMGKRDSVATALHYLASPLTDIGLSLNLDKCALWIQSKEIANIAGVPTYIVKGSPVPPVILGYSLPETQQLSSRLHVQQFPKPKWPSLH